MEIRTALDRVTAEIYRRYQYTSSYQHNPENLSEETFIGYQNRIRRFLQNQIFDHGGKTLGELFYNEFWNPAPISPFKDRSPEVQQEWEENAKQLVRLILDELEKTE